MPYRIETWNITGGGIELHLDTLYRLDMTEAAFEVVRALWPDTETAIRQRARIVFGAGRGRSDLSSPIASIEHSIGNRGIVR